MIKHPKIAVVSPVPLVESYINKNPMSVPVILKKMGYDSVIFATGNELKGRPELPKVVLYDGGYKMGTTLNPIAQLKYALTLNKLVKQERPDAVLFFIDTLAAAFLKLMNPKVKMIITADIEHDSFDKMPYPKPLIWLSFLVKELVGTILITQTNYNYNMTVSFAPFTRKKLRVVRCPVYERFFLKDGEGNTREKIILCVARITPVKRQDLLVAAFGEIADKYPDWKLRFVGMIENKSYFNSIKQQISNLKLEKRIEFAFYIPDSKIREEYLRASIFCLPSDRESPAAVRGEAMAMGVPVVTTATVGSEYVEGKGTVVPVNDKQGLAKGLERYMSDPRARVDASKKEKKFAEEKLRDTKVIGYLISQINRK